MMLELSRKAQGVVGSITLEIDAKAKSMKASGEDVISFGAGEPDFNTPAYISDAAKQALDLGITKYTPASGTVELKKAICEALKKEGKEYQAENIVVSNGAKHALFNTFAAILNDGDEVIIPSPYWVSYTEIIKMVGGVPVLVECDAKAGFMLNIESIKQAVNSKTKAICINSPNNPTGAVYSEESLRAVADIAKQHQLFIVADEIYNKLVYDAGECASIAMIPEVKDQVILINGLSKTYAMTGWRIGYTASAAPIAKAIANYQSHATSNPNSMAQYASVAALKGTGEELEMMRKEFDRRRQYMVETVTGIQGLSCIMPGGAFYAFINIEGCLGKAHNGKQIKASMDFCNALLDTEKVAAVPGIAFGADTYIRLSYAVSMENIEKGLERIKKFVGQLK
ncbi:pyridoxal phosphate-dependent aminotransferase [Clostridia bacterium OttesenSCG-928-F22]|nr:pyridoxal phosphate-dependent aminotransferase [Clostridia bacterium OttesenSCG-928-F22]